MRTQLYILLTAVIFIFGMQMANAQPWEFNGNTTSGQWIGTANAQPFPIKTSGQDRLMVLANGNVGIGTTTPANLLQLYSAGSFNLQLTNSVTGAGPLAGLRIGLDGSGNANFQTGTNFNFFLGNLHMMELLGSNRYMGLGWCSNFNPQSQIHLWNDVNQMYVQIASVDCGKLETDGFKIGVNDDAIYNNEPVAELRQQENAHMVFLTNNTERVRIQDDGEVEMRVINNDNFLDRVLVTDPNNNGVIKYRNANTFVTACTAGTTNYLTKWCANPTGIQNSTIFDNGARVGVNTINPQARMHINNTTEFIGLLSRSTGTSIFKFGVSAGGDNGLINIGVLGHAPYNITFPGLPNFENNGLVQVNLPFNAGVVGRAQGSTFNFGGIFMANQCTPGVSNYGIYASAKRGGNNANGCFYTIAGYFQGDVFASGNFYPFSDVRLKDSIAPISGAISTINKLTPSSYVFKTNTYPHMGLPMGNHYGIISQQVDTILPELVKEVTQPPVFDTSGAILQDSITFKAVNYTGLIPIAIAAIQEQQHIIDSLAAVKVAAAAQPTDSNRLVKWGGTNNTLANSLFYDDGTRLGLPTVQPGSFVHIANTADTVALHVTSANIATTAVVNAVYTGDTAFNDIAAVRGVAAYNRLDGTTGGRGGHFEGGQIGVAGIANGSNEMEVGVFGEASGGSFVNIGVLGNSYNETDSINVGVHGSAEQASYINAGAAAVSDLNSSTAINYGIYAQSANSNNENISGFFRTYDTIGLSYAVYAQADGNAPNHYAGYFDGDVHITGRLTGGSDALLKTNIQPISSASALNLLTQLKPAQYQFKTAAFPSLTLPQGTQYGFIAQDVEQVMPTLVSTITQPEIRDLKGNTLSQKFTYKGLDYIGIIPIIVAAFQEQKAKADSLQQVLEKRLTALEERLNQCCKPAQYEKTDETGSEGINHTTVELAAMQVIVLEQNVPNPFAEQTAISYFLPANVTNAQIVFYDVMGTIIKTADVKPGYGVVTVFAQSLAQGQYSYTLMVNGKAVDTKRMVKGK